jgi:hypothetical protein
MKRAPVGRASVLVWLGLAAAALLLGGVVGALVGR